MSFGQRQFIRFSLEIPGLMICHDGEQRRATTQQISVGGCLVDHGEGLFPGDEFRLELEMPDRNRVPLQCRVVYRFDNGVVGAKFLDITKFEQDLIARTISHQLELDGLPLPVDAFEKPPMWEDANVEMKVLTMRERLEEKLEEIMTLDIEA